MPAEGRVWLRTAPEEQLMQGLQGCKQKILRVTGIRKIKENNEKTRTAN